MSFVASLYFLQSGFRFLHISYTFLQLSVRYFLHCIQHHINYLISFLDQTILYFTSVLLDTYWAWPLWLWVDDGPLWVVSLQPQGYSVSPSLRIFCSWSSVIATAHCVFFGLFLLFFFPSLTHDYLGILWSIVAVLQRLSAASRACRTKSL